GLAREIIETGELIITTDYPSYHSAIKEWVDAGLKSVLGVPIRSSGKIIGALGLFNFPPARKFSTRDEELVEAVGQQAGVAIQNARLYTETQRQMQELAGLFNAALETISVLEIDVLLERIYQQVERLFAPDSFAVILYDSNAEELCIALTMEEHQKLSEWMGRCFPLEEGGLSSWVIQNRRYLLVRDMERDLLPVQPRHGSRVARSWLGVPLVAHDRILGMISVQSFEPNVYDDRHRRLLETLAAQVAIAIVNAQYATDLEKNLNELTALYDLAQKTTSSLDTDEVLDIIVFALKDMIGARAVSIALLDPDTGILSLCATAGVDKRWIQNFRLKVGEGVSGKVIETGQPEYVPDTQAISDFKFFSREVRSLLVVPLRAKDRIIGTLAIDSSKPDAFTEHDEHLLTIAASQVAVAIENTQLYSKVQQMAVTDGLTGVANRRAFDLALQSEVVRAIRYGHPLSLIFLDIDDFKMFNDTCGHPAGDEQLKKIARILTGSVRLPDMVARYGGEEFILLLPHTGKEGACNLAERIRMTAAAEAREALPGEKFTLQAGFPVVGYTLSIGVASIPDDAQTGEELLQAADWAVLEAKQRGKNQVCAS
ncbi:MAG: GAF domain-containing protein, partial [Chloroflexota bacterium]